MASSSDDAVTVATLPATQTLLIARIARLDRLEARDGLSAVGSLLDHAVVVPVDPVVLVAAVEDAHMSCGDESGTP